MVLVRRYGKVKQLEGGLSCLLEIGDEGNSPAQPADHTQG
jgi:hypothetical protein